MYKYMYIYMYICIYICACACRFGCGSRQVRSWTEAPIVARRNARQGIKSSFSIALICTTTCRIPASASADHGV